MFPFGVIVGKAGGETKEIDTGCEVTVHVPLPTDTE